MITNRCSPAELQVLLELRSRAHEEPEIPFLSKGYLVVNASASPTRRHGRRKAHLANLIKKGLIVALDRSRSRTQRYLLGCTYQDIHYYASWLDEIFEWGREIKLLTSLQGSHQGSNRAIRPSRSETPQSLMDKGFRAFMPSRSSLLSSPEGLLHDIRSRPDGVSRVSSRKGRKIKPKALSKLRSKTMSHADPVAQLAFRLTSLTGSLTYCNDALRVVWDELLSVYGFEETDLILHAAYADRELLLNERFPTFSVFNVKYYALNYWAAEKRRLADEAQSRR